MSQGNSEYSYSLKFLAILRHSWSILEFTELQHTWRRGCKMQLATGTPELGLRIAFVS
jgi:hypothetical protein